MTHILRREPCTDAAPTLLQLDGPSGRRPGVDYGAILDRVQARTSDALAWLAELGKRALALAEELARLPDEPARTGRVHELAEVEPWAVAAALLGMASRLARRDPVRAGTLAELAIVAAGEMSADAPASRDELLGQAQALLGESRSGSRRSQEAEEAFARSAANLSASAAETPLSLYCRLLARGRGLQGELGEAIARFDRAAARLGGPEPR
jgi:hypothetical protein